MEQSTRKELLELLKRDELLELVDALDLRVEDRRVRAQLVDSLDRITMATFSELLASLPRNRLKELCRERGLDDSGRAKAPIAARLLDLELPAPTPKESANRKEQRARQTRTSNPGQETRPMSLNSSQKSDRTPRTTATTQTLPQLQRHLFSAADILRGKMDASEFKEYIFGMLFLKRASDQFDVRYKEIIDEEKKKGRSQAEAEKRANHPRFYTETFFVPERARWVFIRDDVHKNVGDGLNKALSGLEEENSSLTGGLRHIDFTRQVGQSRLTDAKLRDLIMHFNRVRFRNEDFEFPDLLGAAYEYLIAQFADSAGKKGGEFYTPRAVVRLMVRLTKPQEGMRIYDPCSGSGGMLIQSKDYVEEQRGDPQNLGLYGQEANGGVWSISQMNMLLHGIRGARIENEDTLAEPRHTEGGELMRFDRVLTNPPFSQNYSSTGIKFPERFHYGWCPENGKKADLMFVQHMVAVLRPGGMVATVMPHGVLFRGGAEKEIRKGFIEDDLLEAVIGLPPNLFYGTGIPASILILRAKGAKDRARRGRVLFINADAEYHEGRAQNYLLPEHIEKIVSAFEQFEDIPNYAAVVSHDELAENDWNLNIRRYADNAPPPEPHDVRAHLVGGVPRAEVAARTELFEAHGLKVVGSLLVEQRPADATYLDFADDIGEKAEIKRRIEADAGLQAKEQQMAQALDRFWVRSHGHVARLAETQALMKLRAELMESFIEELTRVGLLDRYKVSGVIATWWGGTKFDLKTLMTRGFAGLVDSWAQSIITATEAKSNGADPFDHKLVRRLLPEYLDEIAEAESTVAELDSTIKAATASSGDEEEEEPEELDEQLSEAELKAAKRDLSAAKKRVKQLRAAFVRRLEEAQADLTEAACQDLVLGILRADLEQELQRYITAHRQEVIASVETWWDKYRVTLRDIEAERDAAAAKLDGFLKELRYA